MFNESFCDLYRIASTASDIDDNLPHGTIVTDLADRKFYWLDDGGPRQGFFHLKPNEDLVFVTTKFMVFPVKVHRVYKYQQKL